MGSSRHGLQRPLSVADMVVLSLIAEGSRHGYAVNAELQRRQVEDWAPISRAQIYYSLEKLAAEGHIASARDATATRGPQRAVYRLSPGGKRALRAALADPAWATRTVPPPFLTWALLAWFAEPHARAQIIENRERFLDARIAHERETLDGIRRDDPHATTPLVVVELVLEQLRVERTWLEKLKRDRWMAAMGDGSLAK